MLDLKGSLGNNSNSIVCTSPFRQRGGQNSQFIWNSGLYAKLLILLTYVSSVLIIAYSYYEIFHVTIRQSKKKRALNSSHLRLNDDSHDHFEPKAVRRTPRERKRNHKKGQNVSNLPSRSASLRSIASMTSFTMKNLATGNIDIQRTRKKGLN